MKDVGKPCPLDPKRKEALKYYEGSHEIRRNKRSAASKHSNTANLPKSAIKETESVAAKEDSAVDNMMNVTVGSALSFQDFSQADTN